MKNECQESSAMFMAVHNNVGHYLAFVHDEKGIGELAQAVAEKRCLIDQVCFVDCELTLPESLRLPSRHITSSEEKAILSDQFVPLWVADRSIFDQVVCGRRIVDAPHSAEVVPSFLCCFSCNKCAYKSVKQQFNLWRGPDRNKGASDPPPSCAVKTRMDVKTAKTVMEKLRDAGVTEVNITGGGDPLCNIPATICCLKEARKYGMDAGIYTNGYFLDKCCGELLRTAPNFIRVSVYGFNPRSFMQYTGHPASSFTRVINNIELLVKTRDALGSRTKILLSMLISPDLTGEPEELEAFLNRFDEQTKASLDGIRFTPLINYEEKDRQIPREYLERFFACVDAYKINHPHPSIVCFKHRLEMFENKVYTGCEGSALYVEVGPDGGAYFCCEHNLKPEYRIGDLMTENIADIWHRMAEKRCGFDTTHCPAVCKPHEFNKFIHQVSGLNDQEAAVVWGEALRTAKSVGRMA